MKQLIGMIAALLVAIPASAQNLGGFYLGGGIGQSDAKDGCDGISGPGVSCDSEDTAWRLFGGYQLNTNLALELGYTDLGEVSATGPGGSASAEATALEFSALGMFPIAEGFSLYGKAGVYRGEVDSRASIAGLSGSASEDNTDFTLGAGVQFDMTRNIALRGEWQRYMDMGGEETGESDVDLLSVNVLYRF
jgi:OOP family OmpA-OmpF porin